MIRGLCHLGATPPRAVRLVDSALEAATTAAAAAFPKETGGILIGWREPGAIVVAELTEVIDPTASLATYTRSHAHAEAALRRVLASAEPQDPIGYVGEWHVHPAPQGPSRRDRHELRAVARRSAHPIALMVLVHDPASASWCPTALTATSCRVRAATIEENVT